jgi:hypothetical protein
MDGRQGRTVGRRSQPVAAKLARSLLADDAEDVAAAGS